MAGWLKRLLESEEDRKARQMEELSQTDAFRELIKQQAADLLEESKKEAERKKDEAEREHQEKVEKAEDTISALTAEMVESETPYVIVRSIGFDSRNGVQVQLDWNPAFIRYLKAGGIDGRNEDEIVRRWLAMLSHDIIQEGIANDYILNGVSDDEKPLGDFEQVLREIQKELGDDEEESDTRWE